MLNTTQYKRKIISEIESMPEETLPKIARLLSLIREEFVDQKSEFDTNEDHTNHEKTRLLLSSSKGNWAKEIIDDREDRI